MTQPKLSIIIPMRDGVQDAWLQELLKVQGNVEFILVYPPHVPLLKISDSRLRNITSPLQGELFQRVNALLNATGEFILSINCDEYIHPKIVEIAEDYFSHFPESYYVKLRKTKFPYGQIPINKPWDEMPPIKEIQVKQSTGKQQNSQQYQTQMMREIPIAPLNNPLDWLAMFRGRRDHHGPHQENFDKRIWKNEIVQEALKEVTQSFNLLGPFKYIPFWSADRLVGLSVQAKFFKEGKIIGHWLPSPIQLRTEDNPPNYQRKKRYYVLAELSLVRRFPQYSYFWNLTVLNTKSIIKSLLRP